MKLIPLCLIPVALLGEVADPDRLAAALGDRALADQVARMKTDDRISMYEALAKYKPDDFHYQNLLAAAFIQKMRETMDAGYLDRAAKIVREVLAADGRDYEALRLRSEIELERHNFTQAAAYSREMTTRAPDDPWNWGTLGDASMELGDYEHAADAYQRMIALRPDLASYNRASYYRFVAGDSDGAIEVMKRAIAAGSPSSENTAWCLVDLGNMYFKTGRVGEAERAYTAALRVFPKYYPAYAGLGQVYAGQGKTQAAIDHYRRAQEAVPLPQYAAALEDLYTAAGAGEEARRQAAMLDVLDRMETAAGQTANRALAMAFADHDRRPGRALQLAQAELAVRRDIYTYDALAWALYKNKRYAEADEAKERALALRTKEPAFYYHAGMIELALGQKAESRRHLEQALSLNPKFDPRQAPLAQAALAEVRP
jgi:tetratricopeptide (TPR) repeat protein